MQGRTVAHYEILEKIGEGGMGEIWTARDTRLGRTVALKSIRADLADERMTRRLWREARAAAAVNHPNVCQVYDVVEDDGELLVAMELLEGRLLSDRLKEGSLEPAEAMRILEQVLAALEAIHAEGLVHRDLKPANVMLTRHGVKVLDFGLSRTPPTGATAEHTEITRAGQAVGTPRYMSPEQWAGDAPGPATDLYAAGAVLFEMLAGRHAVAGSTVQEILEEATRGRPPRLPREHAAFDDVVARAMARRAADRYASAREMVDALRAADGGTAAPVRRPAGYTRVLVLPFRSLRPDPDTDFLTEGLPDAIVASLSGLQSVVVCSAAGVEGIRAAEPDVRVIGRQAAVDAVLAGTIVRAGEQLRVSARLLSVPDGNVLCARTSQGSLEDIFDLQDRLAREIVRTLEIELSSGDRAALDANRPADGKAYELYLRANLVGTNRRMLADAERLYRACLDRDPDYAPAWARLGRVHRVMAKYAQDGDPAENFRRSLEAFSRALQLDPDLALAHNLYTYLEVEELGRARDAMVRLLERAARRPNDPEIYAGLVLACRFCGLMEESLAADARARALDPNVRTSVHYTHELMGQHETAAELDDEDMRYTLLQSLTAQGRNEEAVRRLREMEKSGLPGLERYVFQGLRASLEGDREATLEAARVLMESSFHDPEGRFYHARNCCRVGEPERALEILEDCVDRGFAPADTFRNDPALEPVRALGGMTALIERADLEREKSVAAFRDAEGERVLRGGR